jgi:hypothetical protein
VNIPRPIKDVVSGCCLETWRSELSEQVRPPGPSELCLRGRDRIDDPLLVILLSLFEHLPILLGLVQPPEGSEAPAAQRVAIRDEPHGSRPKCLLGVNQPARRTEDV